MTLTQLRYIVAVDRLKNFARAAQDCLVAQPTLSLQIQKLEQEIGSEIFDRSKNPVVATRLGRAIIDQARVVLREAERLTELFQENDDEPSGRVNIGIIPTISTYLLPKIYKPLNEKYKQVDFRFYELPTSQITAQLESEDIDLGILATPLQLKNVVEIPLYYEPFVAYFPKNHKGKKKNLTLADIEGLDLILLGEEHCFRNQSLKVCGNSAVGKIECGSIETIKNMVDTGAGMTLLPLLSVDDNLDQGRVASFAKPEPAREISLIYRQGFVKKKLLNLIQQRILKAIPAELRTKKDRRLIGVDVEGV